MAELIVGIVIGGFLGIICMALFNVSSGSDDVIEEKLKKNFGTKPE